ncbi:hypothetical protein TNCV_3033091 [Trichonephila clavipes]|nr:hypothetical protein TNCV_3033091 [Trichonephila clavipes]
MGILYSAVDWYKMEELLQKEFGQRVGRNKTTVMRSCPRWMQEDCQADCVHGTDGSRSHTTNHSTTDSVGYTSFGVHPYHSTPFATEWNVRKVSTASFTLEWKLQALALPIV